MRNASIELVLTVVLVICAVAVTALVARRELFVTPQGANAAGTVEVVAAPKRPQAVLVPEWRSLLDKGTRIGRADAPVQILEFADFECPYCVSEHPVLKGLQDRYPGKIALVFAHFPLDGHPKAEPAARAAVCAGNQGRFQQMHDRLFEERAQFGTVPWSDFARQSGVPDISAFDACINSPTPEGRINDGRALGMKLNIRGTPTLLINGWQLGYLPQAVELNEIVETLLKGRSPWK